MNLQRGLFSLRIELDKVLQSDNYEQLIFENLERCYRLVNNRFYVIFWHKNLNKKEIKDGKSGTSTYRI